MGFGDLRPGLRRLANGLVVYGVIGLIVTLLGLVALAWVGGRIGDLSDRTAARVTQVADTLDATSQALTDASDTAKTFATTLTTTVAAVDAASARVRDLEPTLADLESQFRSVNILGAQPLSRAADVVGSIHGTLNGLDTQLSTVADSLRNGHDRLAANGSSLAVLGTRLGRSCRRPPFRDRRGRPRRRPVDLHRNDAHPGLMGGRAGRRRAPRRRLAATEYVAARVRVLRRRGQKSP